MPPVGGVRVASLGEMGVERWGLGCAVARHRTLPYTCLRPYLWDRSCTMKDHCNFEAFTK
jgi:hypothetical protein